MEPRQGLKDAEGLGDEMDEPLRSQNFHQFAFAKHTEPWENPWEKRGLIWFNDGLMMV